MHILTEKQWIITHKRNKQTLYSYHTSLIARTFAAFFSATPALKTHFHSSEHMCERFRAPRHRAVSADRDPRVRTAASTCSARLALGSLSLMELWFCSRAASLSKQAPGSSETVFFFSSPPTRPPPLYFTALTSRDVNMI